MSRHRAATLLACLGASLSGGAILVHAVGWMRLSYSVAVLAPLSAVGLLALLARPHDAERRLLVDRLKGGLVAGLIGTGAYDLVRLAILLTGATPFDPFRPIEVYGLLILDRYTDTALTRTMGWAFHAWNGLAFATMYTLTVGRGRVTWALAWAMVLELAMLATYPSLFRLSLGAPFVLVSVMGHVAYGLAFGLVARRVVRC